MRLLITGATGLVGRHLVQHALASGDQVYAASRDGSATWPDGVTGVHWPGGELPDVDAVVHLAGASIGGRRWSRTYMETIRNSRVETTRNLVAALPNARLVCANAVGYYGRDPKGPCEVDRPAGDDFLAELCQAWQEEALRHKDVAVVRFGHVLAAHDGLLGRLEPLHKARLAGLIGDGKQSLPWIEVHDLATMLRAVAAGDQQGALNGNVGNATYQQIHEGLCDRIGGFKALRVPNIALRLRLGAFADFLLGGQTVVPSSVDGWQPRFTKLGACLDDLYSS